MFTRIRLLIERLLQFPLPPQCPCCETFLEEGENGFCPDCLAGIRWIEPPFCSICGTPFVSKEAGTHACPSCLTRKRYFTMARALGCYEGSLQKIIHRWKYQGKASVTPYLGEWITERFYRYWNPRVLDLLVPVPLHPKRLRERGFNQALLLARALSRRTEIPCQGRILQKKRPTPPQVQLDGGERERGVKGAFHIADREGVEGKTILLIDDVYTTGATVNECSKVLIRGGAKRVDVLTLAHTMKNN